MTGKWLVRWPVFGYGMAGQVAGQKDKTSVEWICPLLAAKVPGLTISVGGVARVAILGGPSRRLDELGGLPRARRGVFFYSQTAQGFRRGSAIGNRWGWGDAPRTTRRGLTVGKG